MFYKLNNTTLLILSIILTFYNIYLIICTLMNFFEVSKIIDIATTIWFFDEHFKWVSNTQGLFKKVD